MTDETKDKDFNWEKFAKEQKERKAKVDEQRRINNEKLVRNLKGGRP